MNTRFCRERAVADVGSVAVGRPVQQFVEHAAGVSECTQALGRHTGFKAIGERRLQQQRRDDRRQVGVAAALADTVQRPLHLANARADGGERIRNRVLGVIVSMDSKIAAWNHRGDIRNNPLDLVGKRAAVGIAQHDPARASLKCRACHSQGVIAVGFVAVEKVLAIYHRFPACRDAGPNRRVDAREVIRVGRSEGDADMVIPRLGDEADRRAFGRQRCLEAAVVFNRPASALDHAECGQSRARHRGRGIEQLGVDGICARKPAFDVIEP